MSTFPSFDTQTDPTSIGPRWRKWMLRFENRTKAINLTDPDRKLALLLDYAGNDVHDDYLTITMQLMATTFLQTTYIHDQ